MERKCQAGRGDAGAEATGPGRARSQRPPPRFGGRDQARAVGSARGSAGPRARRRRGVVAPARPVERGRRRSAASRPWNPGWLRFPAGAGSPARRGAGAPPAGDGLCRRRARPLGGGVPPGYEARVVSSRPFSRGRTGAEAPVAACGSAPDQGTGEARRSGAGSRGSATFRPLRVLRRLPRFRAYPAG